MRAIRAVHETVRDDIADLVTRRALPTRSLEHLDPFLFLNHHGPQVYPPNNRGLPFGPHPHRGFETVTFILKGSLAHEDTGGHQSVIEAGGAQWMTAGRGLVHSELSPDAFRKNGGELEILQLWLNLPAKWKMVEPRYQGVTREEIPVVAEGGAEIRILSGAWKATKGPVKPLTDIQLMTISFRPGTRLMLSVPEDEEIFFYVIRGALNANGTQARAFQLVEFAHEGMEIRIEAEEDSLLLFGRGLPFHEPIVANGPFVMNTEHEIVEAIRDYQTGKLR